MVREDKRFVQVLFPCCFQFAELALQTILHIFFSELFKVHQSEGVQLS